MTIERTVYEDLKVPGLTFTVKGTTEMDMDTKAMKAIFEVDGGRGKITVEFEDNHDVTVHTDMLAQCLYGALTAQTMRLMQDTIMQAQFQNIVANLERESE